MPVDKAPTRAQQIQSALADDIVHGRIAPGEQLDEARLATLFSVSRTPIREAIRQLEAIGLAEARPAIPPETCRLQDCMQSRCQTLAGQSGPPLLRARRLRKQSPMNVPAAQSALLESRSWRRTSLERLGRKSSPDRRSTRWLTIRSLARLASPAAIASASAPWACRSQIVSGRRQ